MKIPSLLIQSLSLLVWLNLSAGPGYAAGPKEVAQLEKLLWPEPIESRAAFDKASRATILVFVNRFQTVLKPKDQNADLKTWLARSEKFWLKTFLDAQKSCQDSKDFTCGPSIPDFAALTQHAARFVSELPAFYAPWLQQTQKFQETWLNEQLRLAGLFGKTSSEILPFSEKEVFGDELPDGEFLLSLDDGPTAHAQTDRYAELLRQNSIDGYFFVLGGALEQRIQKAGLESTKKLYAGHCLGSHGFRHESHQKIAAWQESLDKTAKVIQSVQSKPKPVHFRPPYGQRQSDLVRYLESKGSRVVLWNLDSQDWNQKIPADGVARRLKALMLLKRKGIVLIHDIHPKGLAMLPELLQFAAVAGLKWKACQDLE